MARRAETILATPLYDSLLRSATGSTWLTGSLHTTSKISPTRTLTWVRAECFCYLTREGCPHQHLLVEVGKEGSIYLIDRDKMGHFRSNDNSQIVQDMENAIGRIVGYSCLVE